MDRLAVNYRPTYVGPALWFRQRLATAALLVALSDFLFYHAPAAGLPVALFLVMLFAAATFNRLRSPGNWRMAAYALLSAAVAALIANADPLFVPLAIVLSAISIVVLVHGPIGWGQIARSVALLPLISWLRLAGDYLLVRRARIRRGRVHFDISGWIVPAGLSLFFVIVFLFANPVIDHWASLLTPDYLTLMDGERLIFWVAMALIVWPFLHFVRSRRVAKPFVVPIANGHGRGCLARLQSNARSSPSTCCSRCKHLPTSVISSRTPDAPAPAVFSFQRWQKMVALPLSSPMMVPASRRPIVRAMVATHRGSLDLEDSVSGAAYKSDLPLVDASR